MAGPHLLRLDGDQHVTSGDGLLNLLASLADHDHSSVRSKRVDAIEQVQQQRARRDWMENLVGVGAHPRPLPGCEDNHGETALIAHGRRNGMTI
jgi:hypothetical protein